MDDLRKAIEACRQCAAAASHCTTAALIDNDAASLARCAQLALDCAAACRLVVSVGQRQSAAAESMLLACAQLCDELAGECDNFAALYCRRCIVVCRYTADACRAAARGRDTAAATAAAATAAGIDRVEPATATVVRDPGIGAAS